MHLDRATIQKATAVAPAVTPLATALLQHQLSLRHTKKTAEIQKDLEDKRAKSKQKAQETVKNSRNHREEMELLEQRSRRAKQTPSQPEENVIDELIEQEDCSMCASVLRQIDGLSGATRERALAEYGELKATMRSADEPDEVREFIESTSVLEDTIENVM